MRTLIGVPQAARVFILEDNSDRIAFFRERLLSSGHPVTSLFITASVQEACEHLASCGFVYDVMFLDHDLSLESQSLNFRPLLHEESGSTFAQRVPAEGLAKEIVIHSWNPGGARNMHDKLSKHVINVRVIPFGTFDLRVI
jgi:hypothetical protein